MLLVYKVSVHLLLLYLWKPLPLSCATDCLVYLIPSLCSLSLLVHSKIWFSLDVVHSLCLFIKYYVVVKLSAIICVLPLFHLPKHTTSSYSQRTYNADDGLLCHLNTLKFLMPCTFCCPMPCSRSSLSPCTRKPNFHFTGLSYIPKPTYT